jgi:hypothetical protein
VGGVLGRTIAAGLDLNVGEARFQRTDGAIGFVTDHPGHVEITLYDVGGRRVRTLHDADAGAGEHRFDANLEGLGKGVYYGRLAFEDVQVDVMRFMVR